MNADGLQGFVIEMNIMKILLETKEEIELINEGRSELHLIHVNPNKDTNSNPSIQTISQ